QRCQSACRAEFRTAYCFVLLSRLSVVYLISLSHPSIPSLPCKSHREPALVTNTKPSPPSLQLVTTLQGPPWLCVCQRKHPRNMSETSPLRSRGNNGRANPVSVDNRCSQVPDK
ncbi:hypothetical protein BKA64DRAFT_26617, partial [Cadophora sp. MPI-SDFR-AT-0126]